MKNTKPNTDYPHIIVRHFAGMYSKIKIKFTNEKPSKSPNTLSLQELNPYDENGILKDDARKTLLEIIFKVLMPRNRISMCLVVSPNESFYCEPDGTVKPSSNVPDGKMIVETSDGAVDISEMLFNSDRKKSKDPKE